MIVSITMGKILMCSTDGANSCTGNLSGKSSEERRGDKKCEESKQAQENCYKKWAGGEEESEDCKQNISSLLLWSFLC